MVVINFAISVKNGVFNTTARAFMIKLGYRTPRNIQKKYNRVDKIKKNTWEQLAS